MERDDATLSQRRGPPRIGAVSRVKLMRIDRSSLKNQEPIGIVISRGSREEATPVFRAYVWGPAPEQDADQVTPKAA